MLERYRSRKPRRNSSSLFDVFVGSSEKSWFDRSNTNIFFFSFLSRNAALGQDQLAKLEQELALE